MTEHPITPPPELVQQWFSEYFSTTITGEISDEEQVLANRAARWGADQELEACCDTLQRHAHWDLAVCELVADRRPKPPSLKEQALEALKHAEEGWRPIPEDCALIRRALEALPDEP